MIIDCQKIVQDILKDVNGGCLVVLYDEADSSSKSYVVQLCRASKKCNILVKEDVYSHQMSAYDVRRAIERWNQTDANGIIFVSPSPEHYKFIRSIRNYKLVEGNDSDDDISRVSCTARACVEVIESVTPIDGKNVLIIGYGKAVGKPLSYLLMRKHAGSVITTHKYTKSIDLGRFIQSSDIIVSAVGKPHFIHQYHGTQGIPMAFAALYSGWEKDSPIEGKVLIDAGITIVEGKVTGDFDPELAELNHLSPVPGGVGPVTTALLLKNVYLSAQGKFFP